MITIEVVGTDRVVAYLNSMPDLIRKSLKDEITQIVMDLQAYIVEQKLNGGVLNVHTGDLRSHIFFRVEDSAIQIAGYVYINPNDVPYAAIHEFGGVIQHPGGTAYLITSAGSVFIANANSLADSLPRTTAHAIPMPQRSYMRSSLTENSARIIERLKSAVQEGIKGT